ncbi:hypothetical protein TSTA_068970 [Talaromyces stipitatus ATCC 10500]|uniref:C2H2-type domain-containing protein n=1 Tax=Talaromyces stipitatus (strain ATCC 10500 / CBS 375.48 / QM 6759 / NRRL 1006) TaxID=441959 RepID=B8LYW5_TALSN|nr:uncharacterized protein TSTA_068970 [Talaromyces stipitatus ATCC 10500]XP_002340861.1 uncharacterized protein TSTA_068970 [Talaromyces stipitatus ATCC 10500]EED23473.1 hypothetical protein TSTA_068970 [Talaromyces stipitatus ATCC 10500]EED23474.1 hypothetical protein TSTA_068970 [Talaromyces stipitatus ATCC 10500]
MYTTLQAHCTSDITLYSGPLLNSVSNFLSQTRSMNMFPQGNRQGGSFHSQQAQWAQYQRSLSATPEDPYQGRPHESSLSPSIGYSSLPSQQVMFSNTSYPIGLQQPLQAQPSQAFYPTSQNNTTHSHTGSLVTSESESRVRVLESRPKPQCWDHGCNGREFSTFSNLLRHQRERSGAAAKSECPHCGAVFTRSTARNTHIAQGKCKGIRESSE